jgi:hypothetical protein
LDACVADGLAGLIYERLRTVRPDDGWPAQVRRDLERRAHGQAAAEILRREEICGVLHALAHAGVRPVLLKGAPLAYTVYNSPSARPRADTDLLIPQDQVACARHTLATCGYRPTVYCDQVFSQFEVQKEDAFGLMHVFDVHWRISTQSVFADLLTYDELVSGAQAVPALGPHARAAGPLHALLLSCAHPVMHHRNIERLQWIYDVHLLASMLSDEDFERFAGMARQKKMAAVCARGLQLAQQTFRTAVPECALRRLVTAGDGEPSAAYLAGDRRWHDELVSILRNLPGWRERLQHLRGVLFPSRNYMLGAYHLTERPLGTLLLPALYVHRNLHGVWKILVGRK